MTAAHLQHPCSGVYKTIHACLLLNLLRIMKRHITKLKWAKLFHSICDEKNPFYTDTVINNIALFPFDIR